MLVDLVSEEGLLPGLQMAVFSHVLPWRITQIQKSLMRGTLNNLGREGNFLNLTEVIAVNCVPPKIRMLKPNTNVMVF